MNSPVLHFYDFGAGVTAFSSTRRGGCSQGNYAEFNANLYCGDDPLAVARNRESLCNELGIATTSLVLPHQVHGTKVVVVDDLMALPVEERQRHLEGVDAVVTSVPGVCIGVSTADCIPILLYDEEHRVAAAVHAGWRGTVARILQAVLTCMREQFHTDARRMRAAIGPGISLQSFEVGDEVYDAFAREDFPMHELAWRFPPMNGSESGQQKWHIDLPRCNFLQLSDLGIPSEKIYLSNICTYETSDLFFSARRLTVNSGRILTGILLK